MRLKILVFPFVCLFILSCTKPKPSCVEIIRKNKRFQLFVNNVPYFINGAVTHSDFIQSVARYGGNAVRTSEITDALIRESIQTDIFFIFPVRLSSQNQPLDSVLRTVREIIISNMHHPSLLLWEIDMRSPMGLSDTIDLKQTLYQTETIIQLIHQLDKNHPVALKISGKQSGLLKSVLEICQNLDIIAIDAGNDIDNFSTMIYQLQDRMPCYIASWGLTEPLQSDTTSWGSVLEKSSTLKAEWYKFLYEKLVLNHQNSCIGSFVNFWGFSGDRSPSSNDMFDSHGNFSGMVNTMYTQWTGLYPSNYAPEIKKIRMHDNFDVNQNTFNIADTIFAKVSVKDPDNDSLTFSWSFISDTEPADENKRRISFISDSNASEVRIILPDQEGTYRLFVYIYDTFNHFATANIPFRITTIQ